MRKHKHATNRRRNPRIVLTLIILAISGVVSIAAYAGENTHDDRINEVKRMRQEKIAGLQGSEISILPGRECGCTLEMSPQRIITQAQNDSEEWMLLLVNAENPLPDNHSPNLKPLPNSLLFDERAIDQLNEMLSAMRAQGLSPVVCSAYRTVEFQRTLFNNKVSQLVASGFSQTQAETEARKSIAYPGTSEHNLGLAADIVSIDYQLLDNKQAETPEVRWLLDNCAEYGFILRYPSGKEAITGITYEPWHFRFVGAAAAREIMASGLCLEEYLGLN
ncbi:MAG: M15 family metallopeptidase [Oscillospiraceae bacterium]|nr:M15 family metallopeptidase [Oscillospiraceae bacterium]